MDESGVQGVRQPIWVSDAMRAVQHTVERIGPTHIPVLVTGESGTGKEVIVRALHAASLRSHQRLVVVDCAAITPSLMESELFGHQKGAFTGAGRTTTGLVRLADGGTFFLDEVGELPMPVQVKLLRLLESGTFRAVGGTELQHADLRIVAATNRTIDVDVREGRFRADLYHRLNGARIHLPALRDRPADVVPLMRHYLNVHAQQTAKKPLLLSPEVEVALREAPWPGNVRELVNCAQYVASLSPGPAVTIADLPDGVVRRRHPPQSDGTLTPPRVRTDLPYRAAKRAWLDAFEAHYVGALLEAHNGNVSKAARESGIDRRSIQRILRRLKRTN